MYAVREIHCPTCEKVVIGRFPNKRKYCSRECSLPGRAENRKTGRLVACAQCGNEIYRAVSAIRSKSFCSVSCHNAHQGRNKTTHVCETCRATFQWSPSRHKANNIRYCSIRCRDADPGKVEQLRRMNNLQQSGKTTSCERLGYGLLESLGIEHERQFMFDGRFCVDAFIPGKLIALQFDGDYWHGNPARYALLDPRQQRRVQLDRSQDAFMESRGVKVFRAWHSDLQRNIEAVTARLQQLLAAR